MARIAPFFLLFFFLTASVLQTGCSDDAQSAPAEEEEEELPALPVETATVTAGNISAFFAGTATLVAEEETDVVAKSGGIVVTISVEEGDYVEAGQALAQLDDERLGLEVSRAEAALNRLSRDLERNQALFDRQLIAGEEIERVRSEYEAQKAAHDLAKLALEHTTVRAPISGVVSSRMIKVGNMVQTYAPTFRVTSFDPLLAEMHVPERELNKLRIGHVAAVRVDALPDQDFRGRIIRISPVVDAATGTFKVTVEVRDSSRKLKPGMFGRIGIVYDTHEGAILVPKQAVLALDDESSVFVVRGDTAYRQIVTRGFEDGEYIEVMGGLEIGSDVITTGQANLRDSSRVEVIR